MQEGICRRRGYVGEEDVGIWKGNGGVDIEAKRITGKNVNFWFVA
jgi:hypothetical protein